MPKINNLKIGNNSQPESEERELNEQELKELEEREIEKAEKQRLQEQEILRHYKTRAQKVSALTRKTRRSKILIALLWFILTAALLVFGSYNTFFKKDRSDAEIVDIINRTVYSNRLFQTEGLEGYLKDNIEELMLGYINGSNADIEKVTLEKDSLYINRVNIRNIENADIYFSMNISTKEKDTQGEDDIVIPGRIQTERYQFMIPIRCEYSTKKFYPMGSVEIMMKPVENSAKLQESMYFAFDGIEELDSNNTSLAKNFIETFLRTLYNTNSDITNLSSISRAELDIAGKTFVAINDFHVYSGPNVAGYNAFVDYTITTDIGVSYRNRTYLLLDYSNMGTWKVIGIQ